VVLPLIILVWVFLTSSMYCQSPTIVNIGAVFTFNSIIGRVAMVYGGGSATPKRQKKKIKKKCNVLATPRLT
jgi:hypothetical protein